MSLDKNTTELQDILETINDLPAAGSGTGTGEDGFSPIIDVEEIDGGYEIIITDIDGEKDPIYVMNGVDGADGNDGKSAYQIAYELDSTIGSEAEWIASLKGSDGDDGASVTITDIIESENDGGENVVTFSDGSTITIKNGSTGAPFTYDQFKPEELEALKPKKDVDYFDGEDYILTDADKTEIANKTKGLLDDTVQEMREIASGKCNADAFDTVEAMTAWLQTDNNAANLKLGDVFYIRDVGVPDYWWEPIVDNIELTKYTEKDVIISGVGAARILETTKVVLDDYALKTDLPALSFVVSDTGPATGTANTVMTIVI